MPKRKRRRFIARRSGKNEVDEACLRHMKRFAAEPQSMKRRLCAMKRSLAASFAIFEYKNGGEIRLRQGYGGTRGGFDEAA